MMTITRRRFLKAGSAGALAVGALGPVAARADLRSLPAGTGPATGANRQVWWIAADTHVGYDGYDQFLKTSVADVNSLDIDYTVIIGDLFEDNRAFLPQFYDEISDLKTPWTYILGNHDYDMATGAPILPVRYFSSQLAGVRIIAVSDEMLDRQSHRTELGKNQDRWLKMVLDEDPRMPTIMLTHQCPIAPRRSVSAFDEWLGDRIKDYNIVLWLVGHAHRWQIDENINDTGFDRIKVGAIAEKHGDRRACESAVLITEDLGTHVRLTVRFRNHVNRQWINVQGVDHHQITVPKASTP